MQRRTHSGHHVRARPCPSVSVAWLPLRCSRRLPRTLSARADATPPQGERDQARQTADKDTLSSLDLLLGSTSSDESTDKQPQLWWQVRPRQDAAPRQTFSAGGREGRFLVDETLLAAGVRAGRTTELGAQLQLPRTQARLVWAVLLLTACVHATSLQVLFTHGAEAQADFVSSLAADANGLLGEHQHWRLLACLFLYPSTQLWLQGLAAWALVGAEAEALMGPLTFAAVFVLPGAAAALLDGALHTPCVCGGPYALAAVLASMAGYYARNHKLVSDTRAFRVACVLALGTVVLTSANSDHVTTSLCGLAASAAGGAWLAWVMGPRLEVSQEVDIPEGLMYIPDDAKEVSVVIDLTTRVQQLLIAAASAAGLLALLEVVASVYQPA